MNTSSDGVATTSLGILSALSEITFHKIIERFGLEEAFESRLVQTPCHGQEHLLKDPQILLRGCFTKRFG